MVFGVKLVKVDEKEPVPVPSNVLVVKEIVGFVVVDQTTPIAVIVAPPSALILPPDVAEVVVIAVMAVVVSVGAETMELLSFRHRTDAPFDTPMLAPKNVLLLLLNRLRIKAEPTLP